MGSFDDLGGVDLQSSNKKDAFDELKTLFELHRGYIECEHRLEHERSTWHLLIQAFLFALLGAIGQWKFAEVPIERWRIPFVLGIAGGITSVVTFISILAAESALGNLVEHWENKVVADDRYKHLVRFFPGMSGGGDLEQSSRRRLLRLERETVVLFGRSATVSMPVIIFVAWIIVMATASNHFPHPEDSDEKSGGANASTFSLEFCKALIVDSPAVSPQELAAKAACTKVDSDYYAAMLKNLYGRSLVLDSGSGDSQKSSDCAQKTKHSRRAAPKSGCQAH